MVVSVKGKVKQPEPEKPEGKVKNKPTNPEGYNGSVPDPRQAEFIRNYLDPDSDTFSNAFQSAIKAGYGEVYAANILSRMPDWLSEKVEDAGMVAKATSNLKAFMNMAGNGKVKLDATKFVAERLGKKKYSARTEHTGADGKDLIPDSITQSKIDESIRKVINGGRGNTTKR